MMTDEEVLEAALTATVWFEDRRERLERYVAEEVALVWLATSEIEGILRGFDELERAGALSVEQRVLQDDLVDILAGAEDDDAERA
jgi:hypothetical protein